MGRYKGSATTFEAWFSHSILYLALDLVLQRSIFDTNWEKCSAPSFGVAGGYEIGADRSS